VNVEVAKTKEGDSCPKCGKAMVLRTARNGKNAGQIFWGCSGYPVCNGAVAV